MYEAKIIADSVSPDGVRLTSIQTQWPHAVHKDFMTHRAFSRNFQSFRAFPPEVLLAKLEAGEYFRPEVFGGRIKGMGVGEALGDWEQEQANSLWTAHVRHSLLIARSMLKLDIAKEQINFVIQDLCSITGLVTATDWDNFWALRAEAENVRPEVAKTARLMHEAYEASEPTPIGYDEWHLPFVSEQEKKIIATQDCLRMSVGRCGRISYLTHDGEYRPAADADLHDRLLLDHHMSPFEHQAMPHRPHDHSLMPSNFRGYLQYRKTIPFEDNLRERLAHGE